MGELSRHDVRPEKGHLVTLLLREPDQSCLTLERQLVARLDLYRGDATGAKGVDSPPCRCAQFVTCRRSRRIDGSHDATTVVTLAGHTRLEFVGPLAREDEVGVRVDVARQHRTSRCVESFVGVGRVGVGPHPQDLMFIEHHGGVEEPTHW